MSLEDLGKRASACKHFYWTQGMLASSGRRVGVWIPGTVCGASEPEPVWPDLDDPATLGCLLYLVREAWRACRMSVCFSAYTPDTAKRWSVPISFVTEQGEMKHLPSFYGSTEAEALVAALEAAP